MQSLDKIKDSTEEKCNCAFEVRASFGELLYQQSLAATEIISSGAQ